MRMGFWKAKQTDCSKQLEKQMGVMEKRWGEEKEEKRWEDMEKHAFLIPLKPIAAGQNVEWRRALSMVAKENDTHAIPPKKKS